jgi:hypothetical protein
MQTPQTSRRKCSALFAHVVAHPFGDRSHAPNRPLLTRPSGTAIRRQYAMTVTTE